jgi:general secretion pathway protein L
LSKLYIRLPSKAIVESTEAGAPLYCQFAWVSGSGSIERDGVAALSEMADLARRAQRVILVLAASDVTLLRVKVPPMSAARLRAALPNLVEDRLMSDPAEAVVVAGDTADNLRTIAVVHRGWLELLSRSLLALGARTISAVPAQLCLPYQAGMVSAAVSEHGSDVEVAIRLGEQEGIGLPVFADQPEAVPLEAIQALCAVVPHAPVTLYVPQTRLRSYQEALAISPALEERIRLAEDDWSLWTAGADKVSIDLMEGVGMAAGPSLNWRPWRWALGLAAALLAINAVALNVDWLRMKREADAHNAAMLQTYRAAYPKETVIIDPLAQMRQKLAAAQRDSGQVAADDFIALTAAFGAAWSAAGQSPQAISGLEYHDRNLTVKLKPDAEMPMDQLKTALAARNLSLSETGSGVWQIRSAK